MLRKKRYFVLYPEYFDKKLSRKQGRKIPRNKAVEGCNLSKVAYACKYLELEYEVERAVKELLQILAGDSMIEDAAEKGIIENPGLPG